MIAEPEAVAGSTADMLLAFAEPLLEGADSEERRDRALGLAMLFWMLAEMDEPLERQRAIDAIAAELSLGNDLARQQFRRQAARMIRRHRAMFGMPAVLGR